MMIGNSMNAKYYKEYRVLDGSEKIIRISWFDNDSNFDEDEYEFLGCVEEVYIEDNWKQFTNYNSNEIQILIECDYCGKNYITTEYRRINKTIKYRGTLRNAGFNIEDHEVLLYKDNCKSCKHEKTKETTMFTQGFTNPFATPQAIINRANSLKEVNGVKTSRGQRYIAKLLNAELNVPIGKYYTDILLDNKVVIEYDGGGHNLSVLKGDKTQIEFDKLEDTRSRYLFSKGYKVLRVVSSSEYLPEDSQTLINILLEEIANLYLTDSNERSIEFSAKVNDPVYGKLLPVKRILEKSEWGLEIL